MKTDKKQKEKHPENFTYLFATESIFDFCENAAKETQLKAEKKARHELKQLETKGLNPIDLVYFLYKNFKIFNLDKLEEDVRYDFIIGSYFMMDKICRTYDTKNGQLYNYLKVCVKNRRINEVKKLAQKKAKEYMLLFDSANELYLKESEDHYQTSCIPILEKEIFSIPKNINEKTIKHLPTLALKASWYLTDDIIDKLCTICSLEKDSFIKIVEKLNEKIEKRILSIEKSSGRLVANYAKQLISQYEFLRIKSDNTIYREILQKRLKKGCKQRKKFDFYRQKLKISTPVSMIAEVLNRPVEEIKNDLRYFKRHIDNFM